MGVVGVKGAGQPSADQLAVINGPGYALSPVAAADVYVRSFYLAHNAIDRDGEFFDPGLLTDFAKTLPGKGMFIKHPMSWDGDSGPAEGKWFGAKVLAMSQIEARVALGQPNLQWAPSQQQAQILVADGYMVRTDDNKALIQKIDAGVAGDCSIGFNCAGRVDEKDQYDNTVADRLMPPGEALEGSLVWLGAQPGARAFKGAPGRGTEQPDQESDMDLKELQAALDKANGRVATLETIEKAYKALSDAVGADLAGNPAALKQAVADGQGARAAVIDEIVTFERGFKQVGDSKDEVAAAKALYAEMPMKNLTGLRDRYKAQKAALPAAGGDIQGGEASVTGVGGEGGGEGAPVIDPKTGKNKDDGKGAKSAAMPDIESNPLLKSA
jgi:hypothetical protein